MSAVQLYRPLILRRSSHGGGAPAFSNCRASCLVGLSGSHVNYQSLRTHVGISSKRNGKSSGSSGCTTTSRRLVRAVKGQGGGGGAGTGVETSSNAKKLNLQEYMIALERPLGIRFAQTINGTIFVHSLKKGGNAERCRMVMVGDVLKKITDISGEGMMLVEDFELLKNVLTKSKGALNLILERPVSPFPIQNFSLTKGLNITFNCGKVSFAAWERNFLKESFQPKAGEGGKSGFAVFSSKLLNPSGWKTLANSAKPGEGSRELYINSSKRTFPVQPNDDIVAFITDEESTQGIEWSYGNFPFDEYANALNRAEGELRYDYSLGMKCVKITDHIHVGSCIQGSGDVDILKNKIGITAILNLQCENERQIWGIDSEEIDNSFRKNDIVVVNCPIREFDSVDLRQKLPFAVGVLYRLLRQNHHVLVTCMTGLNRSPACVIAYLHWIQDVALQEAFDFVTGLHRCAPDRSAVVWATWDLVAMAEEGNHKGPPTHTAQIVWHHGCREGEEVFVAGDFKGDWNELIKAVHTGGQKYVADVRMSQGKYNYKFIVGGQWRHSTSLPVERDQWGNTNNVLWIGDVASVKFDRQRQQVNDPTNIRVIERSLTEEERYALAYAARRIAFAISPLRFTPKA